MNKNKDAEAHLPPSFKIDEYDDYIHISRKWFGFKSVGLAIFTIIWLGVTIAMFKNNFRWAYSDMGIAAFLLMFAALGVFMIYFTLVHWLNITNIFVRNDLIEVKIEPIPWPGNKLVKTADVKQFYAKNIVRGARENRRTYFEVRYLVGDDKPKILVADLSHRFYAEVIAEKIQQYLGIKDDPSLHEPPEDNDLY